MVRKTQKKILYIRSAADTYQEFQDIYFVDESCVVFDFLLLDGFDGELFFGLPVLRQVDYSETSIRKLLFEVVLLLDVAFLGVDEHGTAAFAGAGRQT